MSHPLHGTLRSGRCDSCEHFAAVGEITQCSRCDCQRHVSTPYGGHDPESPPGAEAALGTYQRDMGEARQLLRDARDGELKAKAVRDKARRRVRLSAECPKVGVFDGVRTTVAYVEAWIENETAELEDAYQVAKVARQAASDHLQTLKEQGRLQQSVASSVRESYRGQRGQGW